MKKFTWLSDESREFLANGYIENQTAEERFQVMADNFERISGIKGFSEKVMGYIEKGWVSFASPVLSNFGTNKGLPASCNYIKIADTLPSILFSMSEMGILAQQGAGTARNFSAIRPLYSPYGISGKSVGVMAWIHKYESLIKEVTQGGVRRGFLTGYLSVEHPEIMEFLKIGTEGHPLQKMTTGVTIPAGWIESMVGKDGDRKKKEIFAEIHRVRSEIGYPYILFEDNCNVGKHQVYVDKGFWLDTSNICTECIEYTDEEKEFTCVLSSANLVHYDEWKDTDFIFDLNIMLDCVVTEYIEKAKKIEGMHRAVKYAEEHRAIGVGVMGFHTYLQQNNIVYGSLESFGKNYQIFKHIREESDRASKWMAKEWGEPAMLVGYGDRNTSRIAIAPTKSTSFIMGNPSQGIGTIKSNYHMKDLAKIQTEWKNPNLVALLQALRMDTREVWASILSQNGSVQHLDFLTQHQKDVFKTSVELSPMDDVKLAAQRQPFIDQSQSLNLMIPSSTPSKDIIMLTLEAHKLGIKTLYYQYSVNAAQEFNRSILECTSCEG